MTISSSEWLPKLRQALVGSCVGPALGAVAVVTTIAPLVALIFDGALQAYAATGASLALFSAAVASLVLAWRSSFENTLALPIPEEMVVMAAISSSVVAAMPPGVGDREMLHSVIAAIALTSILTGIVLFALGQLRAGESIRFLPYPVIGGAFAGLGFLLAQGAFRVLLGGPFSLSLLWSAMRLPILWRWLPSTLLAVLLLVLARRMPRNLALFSVAVAGSLGFYSILWARGIPVAVASAQGWLLGPFPAEERFWQPLGLESLGSVNWDVLLPQIPQMLSIVAVAALSVLLVSSGIELAAERDLDLDRELRATGLANILSGLGGGLVGSPSAASVEAYRWGAHSRWVGVTAAVSYLGVSLWGLQGLAFFPRPVLGALLLYLGLDLLWQWLHDTLLRLPLRDYALVLAIALTIATFGFTTGIVIGFSIAIFEFVWDYSQLSIARAVFSGANCSSRVLRSVHQERFLREHGDATYILQLQGLIFFGTVHKFLRLLRARLSNPSLEPLKYVVLDFRWVGGIDSSAAIGFAKLRQTLARSKVTCLLVHLSPPLEAHLRQSGALLEGDPTYSSFPDLEAAIEWCEAQLLEATRWRRARKLPVVLQLQLLFDNQAEVAAKFVQYLEKIQVAAEACIFTQDETAESIYFIESGQIGTIAHFKNPLAPAVPAKPDAPEPSRRVQTLQAGTFVGELEFLTGARYQLSAIADSACTLYRLERTAFERMQRESPTTAFAFTHFINALLAERLVRAQQEIDRFFI